MYFKLNILISIKMKKTVILSTLLILLFSTSFSQVQDSTKKETQVKTRNDEFQTLFGHNRSQGAYGAFSVGYTEIDNKQAVTFGGRFEWIVSHSMGFGFGGTGFINEYHWDDNLQRDVFLTGGYGGLYVEPIFLPKFPVHLSFPVLLGVGGISYITKETNDYENMIEDSEVFLIAEPAAELEFNFTRNFRFALGASYRFTTPFDVGTSATIPISSKAIESWTFMMTFKFGRF
jgi:opacity protein-like surface antigen